MLFVYVSIHSTVDLALNWNHCNNDISRKCIRFVSESKCSFYFKMCQAKFPCNTTLLSYLVGRMFIWSVFRWSVFRWSVFRWAVFRWAVSLFYIRYKQNIDQ